MRLYLASRSPRRRELLHQIGIDFDTVVFRDGSRADSETDETPNRARRPLTTSSAWLVLKPCTA